MKLLLSSSSKQPGTSAPQSNQVGTDMNKLKLNQGKDIPEGLRISQRGNSCEVP
jgi:hypothetical protein